MADNRQKFDLDYNNESPLTQVPILDTFFQNNNVESWNVGSDETIEVSYNSADTSNPTRLALIDYGIDGAKDLFNSNSNATYNAIVVGNQIIKSQMLGGSEGRYELVHYREPPLFLEQNVNYKLPDDEKAIASTPVYAEIAATSTGATQTGIDATFVKINQFNSIIRQKNMTISAPNSNITINEPGLFRIDATMAFTGETSTNFEVMVHVNDTPINHITSVRKTGTAPNDVGAMALFGTVNLSVNDVVDLRVSSDDVTGADFRVIRANFILNKVR